MESVESVTSEKDSLEGSIIVGGCFVGSVVVRAASLSLILSCS